MLQRRKTKRLLLSLLLVVLLFAKLSFAQNPVQAEAEKIRESCENMLISNNLDSARIFADKLLGFSQKESLPFYQGQAMYLLGRYYLDTENLDSALAHFEEASMIFKQNKNIGDQAKSVFFMGFVNKKNGNEDKALDFYDTSAQLFSEANDAEWLGVVNNYSGHIYLWQGNFYMALNKIHNSLAALKILNDSVRIGGTYNTLGLIYRKSKDKNKEEEAYLNAIAYLTPFGASQHLGMAYNNLSEVYMNKGEIEKAFASLEKAKENYEAIDYALGLCAYYGVLSYYYSHIFSPADPNKVIEYSSKGVALAEKYGDMRQFADACVFLGEAYIATGQFAKAENILQRGLAAAKQDGYKDEMEKLTAALSEAYRKLNRPYLALDYLIQSGQIKDSLLNEEKIKEFTSLDLGFRFRQQQLSDSLDNVRLAAEQEYRYRNEIQAQKQWNYFLIIIALMVIAFAVYMIFVRQKLKKTNLLLAEKNAQVQQQNKAIENYNEKINQAYLQLKDLGEYKQAMVNMLIHDLKNPLNTLKHIDIFEDENERKEIINHISKKMLNLVLNMLDVNRGEENKITLSKEELSLRKLLKLAIEDVEFLCRHENIQIEFCFKNDFLIHGDKEILCRVFVNLYLNALKFSPSKGIILLNIEEVTDGAIVVSVKDQGPGIEEKHHRLIFEKFTQLQKINSGKIPSSGLGLAFCKMAIELHGWIIGLESKPGDGAKFWIKISDYKKLPKQNMDTLSMDKKESKSVSGAN